MDLNRKTFKDIVKVSGSNMIKIMSGVLIGILLPKIIGVIDYGYYKTFTLYISYVGMVMLGIGDGIYLKYGGKEYSSLNKNDFKAYTRVFILIEFIISVLVFVASFSFFKGEFQFIFCAVAVYLLFNNITGYFQIISQITSRFTELSLRNVLQSIMVSLLIGILCVKKWIISANISYREFTFFYVITIIILTICYLYTYRDIVFGGKTRHRSTLKDILSFIRNGLPLTFANLCSLLILNLDRQYVNTLFDTETYAVYAFAYNMLALVTTGASAIATVIYPKLKQKEEEALTKIYSQLVSVILILMYICLALYFPMCIFIEWFLPSYANSLIIFRIIFPGLAISATITIVMHNYYKTIGKSFSFFIKSVVILGVSGIFNTAAYFLFKTTISISIASIITLILWYIIVEQYFVRQFSIKWKKNFTYMISMMLSFYGITSIKNYYISGILYVMIVVIVSCLIYKSEIKLILKKNEE